MEKNKVDHTKEIEAAQNLLKEYSEKGLNSREVYELSRTKAGINVREAETREEKTFWSYVCRYINGHQDTNKFPEIVGDKHLCPRRAETPFHYTLYDVWEKRGGQICCSYCGSMSPDSVLEEVKKYGMGIIRGTSKGYKWYIDIPGVSNASEGGIKFYRQHATPDFRSKLLNYPVTSRTNKK